VPFGAHWRYWVRNRERELACLLWTSPAWKMHSRDAWIGWSDEQRQRHLQGIVNNGRFLILSGVRVKGLASKILALNARHLPHDWRTRYGHRPLLLETLVDAQRFLGTCHRAANWIYVGQTAGRGRMDREHKPTVKPSKTFTSTRWSATPGNAYAASSRRKQTRSFLVSAEGCCGVASGLSFLARNS